MNKQEKANEITLEIMRIILEEQNGYTRKEILADNLDKDCEGHPMFSRIEKLIKSKFQ